MDGISHPPYLIGKIKVVYIKVLVLSCGTGGGHNSAAKAAVEELIANLDINKQYILIMTGSMGFENTLEIIDKLSQNIIH